MIRKHYIEVKKAIKKDYLAGPFTVSMYKFSPYSACGHGCAYCDGRAEKYYVEGDFAKDITIRSNICGLLEKELPLLRETASIGIGSGITDVYQPVEKDEGIMRTCAGILSRSGFPVSILTKSPLIQRDLDYWKIVNGKGGFTLFVSLTFADDAERIFFEPGAGSVAERIETLRVFKNAGCAVGILLMPLLPWITDTDKNLGTLIDMVKDIEPDFIIPGYLTLRPGRQKDFFMKVIKDKYPALYERYRMLYGNNKPSGNPVYRYREDFYRKIPNVLSGYNHIVPHYLYRNRIPVYNEVFVLLNHMEELYRQKGIDTNSLKKSIKGYTEWVMEEKKSFNRRRSLDQNHIDEKLISIARMDQLYRIFPNKKLLPFVSDIILQRKCFNYKTLKLEVPSKS